MRRTRTGAGGASPGTPAPLCLQPERERIEIALRLSGNNREKAAQMLGISRSTLWRKIRRFQLELTEKRSVSDEN